MSERKTPLYDAHVALGGKIVPFAGYLLPVQYEGVIAEHLAVRQRVGLFDVSHMGEVMLEGSGALAALNHLLTNRFDSLADGRVRYSPMCNDQGGVVDDLLVYRIHSEKFLIVVNASNREKDVAHMQAHLTGDCTLTDLSDTIGQVALQGPLAQAVLTALCPEEAVPQKYYSFVEHLPVAGVNCLVSRTGYTGEDGFELYCEIADTPKLFQALLDAGAVHGITPCGLGARDTLRLEASMPLYGHEMDDLISPLETGLGFAVKLDKETFVGKQALVARGEPTMTRVGLEVVGRGIVREGETVFSGGTPVGKTTSGTHCPHLGKAVAMALVDITHSSLGTELTVEVRGRPIELRVIPLPFYKRA